MQRAVLAIAAGTAVLLMAPATTFAWGPEAHRAIALVADRVLQQSGAATRAKVQALLAADKDNRLTKSDIASEATWADVLRDKSQEARLGTSAWHAARFKPDNPDLAKIPVKVAIDFNEADTGKKVKAPAAPSVAHRRVAAALMKR